MALGALAVQAALAATAHGEQRICVLIGLYLAAAALWLALLAELRRARQAWRWIAALAVGLRLLALGGPPWHETDMYRFRWDGRVLVNGINPYRYAPSAAEVKALRDDSWRQINFPEVPTIYGPAAQAFFGLAAALGLNTVKAFQVGGLLLDLAVLWSMIGLARALGLPRERIATYALCPLPILQFVNSAHVTDQLMLVAIVLSLTAMVAERRPPAAAWLAAAVLVKPAPLVLLPFYLYRWRGRDLTVFAACLLAGYAPFAGVGVKVFAGLGRFAHEWTFNAGLFRWTQGLLGWAGAEAPGALARIIMLAVLAVTLAQLLRRDRGQPAELPRHAQSALFALLLTSPVANAWYVAWLGPLTVVRADPAVLAWMVTSVVSYVWYFPSWSAGWMRVLEYLPVLALLVREAWRRSRRRSSPA